MTERVSTPAIASALVAFQQRRFDLFVKSVVLVVGTELRRHNASKECRKSVAEKISSLWRSFRAELAHADAHRQVLDEVPAEFAALLAEIGHPHA
jgi:hypothetical protein